MLSLPTHIVSDSAGNIALATLFLLICFQQLGWVFCLSPHLLHLPGRVVFLFPC